MSRRWEWEMYQELSDTFYEIMEEFIEDENLYERPRISIYRGDYGGYEVELAEYMDLENPEDSYDAYKFVNKGEIDYEEIDDVVSLYFDLR